MSDVLDILTLNEGKDELGIPTATTTYDTVLASWITAISRRLDDVCGPVVVRTIASELYSGGVCTLQLKSRPVSSITSVTEYTYTTAQALTAETNTIKTAFNYLLDYDRTGILRRRTAGADMIFAVGRRNIEVTYVAGRAASTAAVDARFKQAARICLKHLWRAENSAGTVTYGATSGLEAFEPSVPTFAIPRAALELVADELIGAGSEIPVA